MLKQHTRRDAVLMGASFVTLAPQQSEAFIPLLGLLVRGALVGARVGGRFAGRALVRPLSRPRMVPSSVRPIPGVPNVRIASSTSVSTQIKVSRGARSVNPSKTNKITRYLTDKSIDVAIGYGIASYFLDKSGANIAYANTAERSLPPDAISFSGIDVEIENTTDRYISIDVSSYIFDLDDGKAQDLFKQLSGVVIDPYGAHTWSVSDVSNIYIGRKVLITEKQGELINISDPFYIQ